MAPGGTGVGSATPNTSLTTGPQTVTYNCTGTPGQTCTFGVSLSVANSGGSNAVTKPNYITVTVPPLPPDPMADFTGTPRTGIEPTVVNFTADDPRNPDPVTYTAWDWDLSGDGTFDATGRTPSRNYPNDGAYDITLRVTDSTGGQSTDHEGGLHRHHQPDLHGAGLRRTSRRTRRRTAGRAAGFTTPGAVPARAEGNYRIQYQSIIGGTIDPQPNGCAFDHHGRSLMRIRLRGASRASRRGQSLVEFALVFPIAMLVLMARLRRRARGLRLQRPDQCGSRRGAPGRRQPGRGHDRAARRGDDLRDAASRTR